MYNSQFNNPYYGYNQQQYQQPMQQKQIYLQGKTVDSIDVAKSIDYLLDGSISYYPLVDGSAIVSKQLQNDGTSKILVYKPITDKEQKVEYLTRSDLSGILNDFTFDEIEDIKEELKDVKKEIKGLRTKEK